MNKELTEIIDLTLDNVLETCKKYLKERHKNNIVTENEVNMFLEGVRIGTSSLVALLEANGLVCTADIVLTKKDVN